MTQSDKEVKKTLEERASKMHVELSEKKKYAVLLNGDDSMLHQYNVSHAYNVLKQMDFKEEDIFILSSNDPRSYGLDDKFIITGNGTKKNLERVMDYLSKIVDNNDVLMLYVTGHGGRSRDQSYIALDGDNVSADNYKKMLEKMKAEVIVSVMDQCYSGGFVTELADSKARVIAMANTDDTHSTFCKYFSDAFWDAFSMTKPDTNKDGHISIKEAYDFAMTIHKNEMTGREDETNGQYIHTKDTTDMILK